MRDINRIDCFLSEVGKIWKDKCPDWRFGQLIFNFLSQVDEAIFFWEEDRFLEELKKFFNIKDDIKPMELRNVEIYVCPNGDKVAYGRIYNDIKCRFVDGTHIHTSKIIEIDYENKVIKTKNSEYKYDTIKE